MQILTVCGSFHSGSANRVALTTFANALTHRSFEAVDSISLEKLPALNPKLDDPAPEPVRVFRAQVARATGVVIASPEYAGGLAGAVKNATDWCVGSGDFYGKPVAVISAGTTGGMHARTQLVRTLLWQGAHVIAELGIAAPKTKLDAQSRWTDATTISALERLAGRLTDAIQLSDDERAKTTRHLADDLGIVDYPHQPDDSRDPSR